MKSSPKTGACGLAVLLLPCIGSAAEPASIDEQGQCSGPLSRSNVIACTLAISPLLREELASLRAGDGRLAAARPILPSNPVLSGGLASRTSPTAQQLNWNVGLAQELEVGGQRGLRIDFAQDELRVQTQRIAATKATIAADAWLAYFRSIAARERLKLTAKLEAATEEVATTVRGMAAAGLASEVDADVAEAAAIRASQDRLKAEELLAVGGAQLRLLVGGEGALYVVGELEPLRSADAVTGSRQERPELLAARAAQAALTRRVALLRRARVPNPTLSLFYSQGAENAATVSLLKPRPARDKSRTN